MEICALLGYYAVSCGNCLQTFRDNVSASSWIAMGPIRCPETSVNNYHTTPRNIPEERRSHQYRGGKLKSKLNRQRVFKTTRNQHCTKLKSVLHTSLNVIPPPPPSTPRSSKRGVQVTATYDRDRRCSKFHVVTDTIEYKNTRYHTSYKVIKK
jgi:hypothetical protein